MKMIVRDCFDPDEVKNKALEEKTIEIELCSQLFDRLTIIKGYLMLNVERKKIDYTPLILREVKWKGYCNKLLMI